MKQLLTLLAAVLLTATTYAQVGINTENPDPSSALDINSTTGGLLTPRMTNQERLDIQNPAVGLLVYQTDGTAGFYYHNGTSWAAVSGSGGSDTNWLDDGTGNISNSNTGSVEIESEFGGRVSVSDQGVEIGDGFYGISTDGPGGVINVNAFDLTLGRDEGFDEGNEINVRGNISSSLAPVNEDDLTRKDYVDTEIDNAITTGTNWLDDGTGNISNSNTGSVEIGEEFGGGRVSVSDQGVEIGDGFYGISTDGPGGVINVNAFDLTLGSEGFDEGNEINVRGNISSSLAPVNEDDLTRKDYVDTEIDNAITTGTNWLDDGTGNISNSNTGSVEIGEEFGGGRVSVSDQGVEIGDGFYGISTDGPGGVINVNAFDLTLGLPGDEDFNTVNVLGSISATNAPTNAADLTRKDYVDNAITTGTNWLDDGTGNISNSNTGSVEIGEEFGGGRVSVSDQGVEIGDGFYGISTDGPGGVINVNAFDLTLGSEGFDEGNEINVRGNISSSLAPVNEDDLTRKDYVDTEIDNAITTGTNWLDDGTGNISNSNTGSVEIGEEFGGGRVSVSDQGVEIGDGFYGISTDGPGGVINVNAFDLTLGSEGFDEGNEINVRGNISSSLAPVNEDDLTRKDYVDTEIDNAITTGTNWLDDGTGNISNSNTGSVEIGEEFGGGRVSVSDQGVEIGDGFYGISTDGPGGVINVNAFDLTLGSEGFDEGNEINVRGNISSSLAPVNEDDLTRKDYVDTEIDNAITTGTNWLDDGTGNISNSNTGSVEIGEEFGGGRVSVSDQGVEIGDGFYGISTDGPGGVINVNAFDLTLGLPGDEDFNTVNVLGSISATNAPTNAADLTRKDYVDNAITTGTNWLDDGTGNISNSNTGSVEIGEEFGGGRVSVSDQGVEIGNGFYGISTDGPGGVINVNAFDLTLGLPGDEDFNTVNVLGSISATNAPTNAADLTRKDYVDNAITTGTNWLDDGTGNISNSNTGSVEIGEEFGGGRVSVSDQGVEIGNGFYGISTDGPGGVINVNAFNLTLGLPGDEDFNTVNVLGSISAANAPTNADDLTRKDYVDTEIDNAITTGTNWLDDGTGNISNSNTGSVEIGEEFGGGRVFVSDQGVEIGNGFYGISTDGPGGVINVNAFNLTLGLPGDEDFNTVNVLGSISAANAPTNADDLTRKDYVDTEIENAITTGTNWLDDGTGNISNSNTGSVIVNGILNTNGDIESNGTITSEGVLNANGGIFNSDLTASSSLFATSTGTTTLGGGAVDVSALGATTTIKGDLVVDGSFTGDVTATSVENGVYTVGDQTIAGTKTFSDDLISTGMLRSEGILENNGVLENNSLLINFGDFDNVGIMHSFGEIRSFGEIDSFGTITSEGVLNANGGIFNSDLTASSSLFATSTGTTTLGGGAVDVSALGATTTIKGDLVVDGSFTGDVTATSVENGVYTVGDQTIAGTKTFSDDLISTGMLRSEGILENNGVLENNSLLINFGDFDNVGIMHSFGEIRSFGEIDSFGTITSEGVLNANGGIFNSDLTASSSLFATSTGTTTLGGGAVVVSALGATTTIKGDLVVDGSFTGDVTATSVENGVYTVGDQTIAGDKTFSDNLISNGDFDNVGIMHSFGEIRSFGGIISFGEIDSFGTITSNGVLNANGGIVNSDITASSSLFATSTGTTTLGGGAVDVSALGATTTIKGDLVVDGSFTGDVTATSVENGVYTVGDQTIAGDKTFSDILISNGDFWNEGTMHSFGTITSNGVLNANGGIFNSDLTASSSLFATSTGTTTLGGGAVVVSALGATTTIKGDLVVDGSFTGDVTATSVENGVYTVGDQTIAGDKTFSDNLISNGDFDNVGIMHSFGEIRSFGGIISFGEIDSFGTITSNGVLNANGGIVNSDITASSSLFATSTGTTTLGGGAVDVSALGATTTIKGDLVVDGSFTGDVTATSVENGVYTVGDQTIAGDKTFSDNLISNGDFWNEGTMHSFGEIRSMGTLRSDGILENNGDFWNDGIMHSFGEIRSMGTLRNEGILENNGLLMSPGNIDSFGTITSNGVLNANGGIVNSDITASSSLFATSTGTTTLGGGAVDVSALGATTTIKGDLVVDGSFTGDVTATSVENGVYTVGDQTIAGDKTFSDNLISNGDFWNEGTMHSFGEIRSMGTLRSDGILENNGDFWNDGIMHSFGEIRSMGTLRNEGILENNGLLMSPGNIDSFGTITSNGVLNANGGIFNSDLTASSSLFATSTGTTTLGGGAVDVSALGATTTIKGDLVVDGSFTGDVTATSVENGVYTVGDQTIAGTKTFSDGLYVGGFTSLSDLSVGSDLSVLSDLNVGGFTSLSDLSVGSHLSVLSDLNVGGFTSLSDLSVGSDLSVLSDLNVGGFTSLSDLSVGSDLFVLSDLNVGGSTFLSTVYADQYITTSDRRLKNNIKPMTKAIDKVMALNPVSYNKKKSISDSEYVIQENGFIAQELQKVMPKLVKVGTDKDKTLSVNYSGIIPVLTKAIQEQQKEIEELKQLVKKLLSSK